MLLLLFIYTVCKMDITKSLQILMKRDLSNQSIVENNKKKVKEGILEENSEVDSVFTNSIDSPECLQILFNCYRNVEKSVKEIHEIQGKTQSS